jgi:hypothetical protein
MDTTKLAAIVTLLVTLSLASERLVEIIKGFFPKLTGTLDDPQKEAWRKSKISILAVFCGILTAFLASPLLAGIFKDLFKDSSCELLVGWFASLGNNTNCGFDLNTNGFLIVLALGLLASAGSPLWNSVLGYLLKVKDIKTIDAEKKKMDLEQMKIERELFKKGENMLDDEIAKEIVKKSIRIVGGLGTSSPIRMQNALKELLIVTSNQVNQLRVRIVEDVAALDPPFDLDVGFLQEIDTDTTVRGVIDIVASNSVQTAESKKKVDKRRN